ncbi:hypothetical protein GCM10022289_43290 [Pedobacter jeongneungensis]|uniref:DUF4142 domain-containing protein n=1 Tax=Pedobacter jeongneungensis TaxID=947309 RepID=A0ABP8BPJ1_9SPHI
MKKNMIYGIVLCTAFSCNDAETQTNNKETPAALQDDKSYNIISKRGSGDLIENLYADAVSKDSALKKLAESINEIRDEKTDSLKKFDIYDGKNQEYFTSANYHLKKIKDSLLRKSLTTLIAKNLEEYNDKVSSHRKLVKTINAKMVSLNDLELALKVSRTFPLIKKYQKENLPNQKSILNLRQNIDQAIKLADTLYKSKTQ